MPEIHSRLGLEALEGRDCPAVNFFNNVLTLTGTGNADTLIVSQSGGTITTEGQSFSAASVSLVVITGLGGNDVIRNNTSRPGQLYGGTGNDILHGGSATDRMFGGHGADTLFGKAGNDVIYGGSGTDTVNGGAGTNTVVQGGQNRRRGNTAIETQIINLVNARRAEAGLPPLRINLNLNAAAALHTTDMVGISNLYGPTTGMQHTLYGTARPQLSDRLDAVGYDTWTTSFAYGENIAYGYSNAASVMNAWMNSSGHRANILSTNYTDIGVGVGTDSAGRLFFTQVFGRSA